MDNIKYKIITCFIVWNNEADCQASEPLFSEKLARQFIEYLERKIQ